MCANFNKFDQFLEELLPIIHNEKNEKKNCIKTSINQNCVDRF